MAVGSVLAARDDEIVAEGRNHAYDPQGGPEILQGSPLAHAEMNALAAARTSWDLSDHTLWSTQEPCSMCAAAAQFTGVGRVRYLAPDPSEHPTGVTRDVLPDATAPAADGPAEDTWLIVANVMFLLSVEAGGGRGLDHPMIVRNLQVEPETTNLVIDLVRGRSGSRLELLTKPLDQSLPPMWETILASAEARRSRSRRSRVSDAQPQP